jgi:polysaccharide biosynthesis/export protein
VRRLVIWPAWISFSLFTGCVNQRADRIQQSAIDSLPAAVSMYRIGCGDVVELRFRIRPDWDSICSVDVDGTLPLPESLGVVRCQGLTLEETRLAIAKSGSMDSDGITIRLIEPRSCKLNILGPVNGQAKTQPYCGPEPVLDFLIRTGAMQSGTSNFHRVYVLRPNVAIGEKAEVFHVDVEAVAIDSDQTTNLTLQPGDQIYVGETRRSSFARLLPDWARPTYRKIVGVFPFDGPRWWELRE